MSTQIFATRKEFNARPDKAINGVSPEFADKHPNYEADNQTNWGCWNCRHCDSCEECHDYQADNDTNWGCGNCRDCYDLTRVAK